MPSLKADGSQSPSWSKPCYPARERVSRVPRRVTARRAAIRRFQREFRRRDELGVKRQDIEHGAVIAVGKTLVAALMRMALFITVAAALTAGAGDLTLKF